MIVNLLEEQATVHFESIEFPGIDPINFEAPDERQNTFVAVTVMKLLEIRGMNDCEFAQEIIDIVADPIQRDFLQGH
mgnify:CR=1 FL=1